MVYQDPFMELAKLTEMYVSGPQKVDRQIIFHLKCVQKSCTGAFSVFPARTRLVVDYSISKSV
jgi:hypothetical protein